MFLNRKLIYFFSSLLAFCSLFYEYALVQILSVYLGGTTKQYLIVVSLFTFALGLGSQLQYYFANRFGFKRVFLGIEILLVLLGAVSPFLIAIILDPMVKWMPLGVKLLISYSTVFFIGLLSGFEIPSMFRLAENSQGKVLGFDYIGMLAASVLFPFWFLSSLGVGASSIFVANLNFTFVICYGTYKKNSWIRLGLAALNLMIFILVIYGKDNINHLLSQIYLGSL